MYDFDTFEIRIVIDSRYNKSELQALCQDLRIDYDNLRGETKIEKITDLISFCQRKSSLPELVKLIEQSHGQLPSLRKPDSKRNNTKQAFSLGDQDKLLPGSRDYLAKLERYLSEERWKEADIQTLKFLLFLVDQEQEGILKARECERLFLNSKDEILLIDQLWTNYSHALFGFSVQKGIYESVSRDFNRFCFRVGWRKPAGRFGGIFSWKTYDELTFSTEAERGHLPFLTYKDAAASTLASRLGMIADHFFVHCTLRIEFPKRY